MKWTYNSKNLAAIRRKDPLEFIWKTIMNLQLENVAIFMSVHDLNTFHCIKT